MQNGLIQGFDNNTKDQSFTSLYDFRLERNQITLACMYLLYDLTNPGKTWLEFIESFENEIPEITRSYRRLGMLARLQVETDILSKSRKYCIMLAKKWGL